MFGFNPLSATGLKLIGGLVAALLLAGLWLRGEHYRHQRDTLQAWQDEVALATRDAAHRPKLAVKAVAQQVRYLGQGLDQVRTAMTEARGKALAAKLAADQRNEQNRKDADHALDQAAVDYRRRSDAYAAAHRVPGIAGDPPAADRGDDGSRDLPRPAFGAAQPDRAGGEAELVAIPRSDLDICTVNTARLENAHNWAETLATGQ